MASPAAMSSESAARATTVSGPIISITPLSHDFGRVNVGTNATFMYSVSNLGDAVLHVTFVNSTGFPAFAGATTLTVAPGASEPYPTQFQPSTGGPQSTMFIFTSDASNGTFSVNATGMGNTAPTLDPIGNKSGFAFVNMAFDVTASDAEGDALTLSASGLPVGATFDTNTGHFDWTPGAADAGSHSVMFSASDGLASDSETIMIAISAGNNPPVSNPGGPYSGATGQPVSFNGSGSSDPDGNTLTYAWDFGDGGTATSALASHTYSAAGSYLVSLTVTDDGTPSLSNTATTSASILNLIPASINLKLPPNGNFKVNGGGTQIVGIETTAIPATSIDPASVKMSTTYPGVTGQIGTNGAKGSSIGDVDNDNVPDLVVQFSRSDINGLLGGIPNNTTITLVITATSTSGVPIRGTASVKVKGGSGAAVSALASPNPFNPQTKVQWTLKSAGETTVRIYSLEGRLVKTLHDGFAPAGMSEAHWNGLDNAGRQVPTGVYFLQVVSAGEKAVQKLYLLK
jgi:PKD repeat protein